MYERHGKILIDYEIKNVIILFSDLTDTVDYVLTSKYDAHKSVLLVVSTIFNYLVNGRFEQLYK